jgi:pectate lyase
MTREIKLSSFFLAITAALWLLALLFLFRVVNIFDAYLMKFPGPVVIYGLFLLCPIGMLRLGWKIRREQRRPGLGGMFVLFGSIFLAVFILLIAVPMIRDALSPKAPKNPSTPRPVETQVGLPVFPGAEGFGTRTIAGRGGKVIEVSSLEDDGPGSLRAALDDPEPRTVVFRVGGTIELQSELQILHPFLTVAGQTAPGGGICIQGAGITIQTHDVLIQHIRVRPGNEGPVEPDINDAFSLLGDPAGNGGAYNVVLDHVSASWGEDETISTWYGAHDITISWSIISEALDESRHRKETHSAGLLIGDSSYNVSVHHNLLAHNDFRNPLISEGGTHDIVNNIIYNWGVLPAEIIDNDANTFLNFIGNYFIPGQDTQAGPFEILFPGGNPKIFVEGNLGPHRLNENIDDWALVGLGWGEEGVAPEVYRSFQKFHVPTITIMSAEGAKELVLAHAGATKPLRDPIDFRIVEDVRNGTGSIIDAPEDVGGYPHLAQGSPLLDSDHDGMPDKWEEERGLNPYAPEDRNGDFDGDGYTNLEEYLFTLLDG